MLSSNQCNISSKTYEISSKIIIIFYFVGENVLRMTGFIEMMVNFITKASFCCCDTETKSNRFYFAIVQQQHFFSFTFFCGNRKKIVKITQGYLHFFLQLSTQHIALQVSGKCYNGPSAEAYNVKLLRKCQNVKQLKVYVYFLT